MFKYRFHVLEYGFGWEWWWYDNDGNVVDVIIEICGDRKSIHYDNKIGIGHSGNTFVIQFIVTI